MKPMNGTTSPAASLRTAEEVDAAIEAVEELLRVVTGRDLPACSEATRAPVPPEQELGRHVEGQIERLMALLPEARQQPAWSPSISLHELPEELLVMVDLPGVSRSGVEVSMERGFLEVKGERVVQHRRRPSATWNEARFGAFSRRVPLPAGATAEGMRAEMTDGVLEVRIPVLGANARRVAVQSGADRDGSAS